MDSCTKVVDFTDSKRLASKCNSWVLKNVETLAVFVETSEESNYMESKLSERSIAGIPDDIVREVASYLNESEYVFFAMTNKHHLSVCRSPNMVQTLTFAENDKLSDYPRIRFLYIQLDEFANNNSFESIIRHCPQLTALSINARGAEQVPYHRQLRMWRHQSHCFPSVSELLSYFVDSILLVIEPITCSHKIGYVSS